MGLWLRLQLQLLDRERFIGIFLDSHGRLIDAEILSEGTRNKVEISLREIFKVALRHNAESVIFVHNHPSGDTDPSEGDLRAACQLALAMKAIDVHVDDFLIVGDTNKFYSFKQHRHPPWDCLASPIQQSKPTEENSMSSKSFIDQLKAELQSLKPIAESGALERAESTARAARIEAQTARDAFIAVSGEVEDQASRALWMEKERLADDLMKSARELAERTRPARIRFAEVSNLLGADVAKEAAIDRLKGLQAGERKAIAKTAKLEVAISAIDSDIERLTARINESRSRNAAAQVQARLDGKPTAQDKADSRLRLELEDLRDARDAAVNQHSQSIEARNAIARDRKEAAVAYFNARYWQTRLRYDAIQQEFIPIVKALSGMECLTDHESDGFPVPTFLASDIEEVAEQTRLEIAALLS